MNRKKQAVFWLEKVVFPLILVLYPLVNINQGIDITDTTYNLANFRFFTEASGSWQVATYFANVIGYVMMHLPFGDTMLGMNFYTSLTISFMALLAYWFLKGKMSAWLAFLGEFIAIGFCWCPTTKLYDYLSYVLFLCGTICLYRGLIWEKKKLLAAAGICLGVNLTTRMPNITECALILAVFYYGWLKKKSLEEMMKQTGICVAGYLAGFLAVLTCISIQYGPGAYWEMITGLTAYQTTDSTYSPFSMIASVLGAYASSLTWVILILVCALAGRVMFAILPGRFENLKKAVFVLCMPVLLRLLWGRGMFNFEYTFYMSMFQWGMLLLYLTIAACLFAIFSSRTFYRDRLLCFMVLIILAVTPLGSNNETYPNLNNLFLAAPVALWQWHRWFLHYRTRKEMFPYKAMLLGVFGMITVQATGFGVTFVFRDGMEGQQRTAQVENSSLLKGMYTTPENAEELSALISYVDEQNLQGESLLVLGNAPGLHYILDMPSATSHGWMDLGTYAAAQMEEELKDAALKSPLIIWREEEKTETDGEGEQKAALLHQYIEENEYTLAEEAGSYRIYTK